MLSTFPVVFSAEANIYATNIKLDGHTNSAVRLSGQGVAISFILNDYANAGATIAVLSGTNAVRTITVTNGDEGTWRGTNTIIWDGKDDQGRNLVEGAYRVSITAGCDGYPIWTQITEDPNPANQVFEPRGIAVNCNTNSPDYGRIFVGNAPFYGGPETGIFILNADGSPSDDGLFSTGGYFWAGGWYSPWKMEISSDDILYVEDFTTRGTLLAFDQNVSSNSLVNVLRPDNWPDGPSLFSGPAISDAGSQRQIWMADLNPASLGGSLGIVRWNVSQGGSIASNDCGAVVVAAGPGTDLNIAPFDVALDRNGHIYTIQQVDGFGDPSYRVFRFSPAQNGEPQTKADWKIGSGNDLLGNASGIAVDPTGTYVAVSSRGAGAPNFRNGGISILRADTGAFVTNILELLNHQQTDIAWDNVGNVYCLDLSQHVWRAFSPPGSNQTTTVALPLIQIVNQIERPLLSAVRSSGGDLEFTLSGQSNVSYLIETSTNLVDWAVLGTNFSASPTRDITVPSAADASFFRAVVSP